MADFGNQPVGKPLACGAGDCCKAGWDRVYQEVDKVDGIEDVMERNKAISASYAELYIAAPELTWAGTAAFASKQVGCAMSDAQVVNMASDPLGFLAGAALSRSGMSESLSVIGRLKRASKLLAMSTGAGATLAGVAYGSDVVLETLADGNLAVYDELYPPLRFYQQNKGVLNNKQILECMTEKPGAPVDQQILSGLQQVMQDDPVSGALTMLKHEQEDTLQKAVYDESWIMRRAIDVGDYSGGVLGSMQLVFDAKCSSDNLRLVVDFNDDKYDDGHLYNFQDRWGFAQDCAQKFVDLASAPDTESAIMKSLHDIANAGSRP